MSSKKNDDSDAIFNVDLASQTSATVPQLGQITYTFFVDQLPASAGSTPSTSPAQCAIPSCSPSTAGQDTTSTFVHPTEQRRLDEVRTTNGTDPGQRYQMEFTQKLAQVKANLIPQSAERSSPVTVEGAADRQTGAGFSAGFNFMRSLDRLFTRLDTNRDGRLSKAELQCALADSSFSGDEEMLLLLLLRHIGDIASNSSKVSAGHSGDVSYESIRNYRGWQKYLAG